MNDTETEYRRKPGSSVAGYASAKDPAFYEQVVCPWDLCLTPLERGDFAYEMRYLKLPGIIFYKESFDLRCRLLGVSPAETFAFAVPLFNTSRSTFWGSSVSTYGMPATLPGAIDVDLRRGHTQMISKEDDSLNVSCEEKQSTCP